VQALFSVLGAQHI
jgi:hypothetical protein